MVWPESSGQSRPLEQLKITGPQSKPLGQSSAVMQSSPQNEPVWPSLMNSRQCPAPAQRPDMAQSSQSLRPECTLHVPLATSQNSPTPQNSLSRQNDTHWWLWHDVFVFVSNSQSEVLRQPGLHDAVAASQIW